MLFSIQRLLFDWGSKPACYVDDGLTFAMDACFGPDDFVEATLHTDPVALQKAEDRGDLYSVSESWHKNLGAVAENMGAGSEPVMALILAILNRRQLRRRLRRMIQESVAHVAQDQRVLEGIHDGRLPTRLVVKLRFWAGGGMGSGAMHWFLGEEGIRSCAQQDGVDVSLIVQVVCRGNLETKDEARVDLNQFMTLKYFQTRGSGTYLDPLTGEKQPTPCAALFLSSNQNNNGDMTSLRQVQAHEAHCDHFLYCTPGGARMRELFIDILEPRWSEYGEPLMGKSIACAFLSHDRSRVLKFCAYRGAALLARAATVPGDADKVRHLAASCARQASILESEEENDLTRRLTHPDALVRQDIVATAKGSFESRTLNCHGLQRLVAGAAALQGIRHNDIPETYGPSMCQQGEALDHAAQDLIEQHYHQMMRTACGLSESRSLYASVRLIAQRSQEALMQKASELRELLGPHEQILAEAFEEIDRLQKSSWLTRTLNLPLIHRLSASLLASGMAAISYELQMAACTIAVNDVLMPLIAYLDNKLAWLAGMERNLLQTAQICDTKADGTAAQPTTNDVPQGLELTDARYLHNYFEDRLAERGGQDQFAADLLGQFLQEHGTLAVLTDAPLSEYEQTFVDTCEKAFWPGIENADVVSEFLRLYPDRNMQLRLLERLIKSSEGCFPTTGEGEDPVVWIKTANAPSEAAAEWVRGMLERVDRKPGAWEVQVQRDPDRIGIAQLRGDISLQAALDHLGLADDPRTWAKLVEHAPDPVSVLIVPPKPTIRQFKRVLAKAIVTEQLVVDEKGCFVLASSSGETLVLGKHLAAVKAFLLPRWRELVFVESTFGSRLVTHERQVMERLQDLKVGLGANSLTDVRLGLINVQAVEDCLQQAELLLPRLRRIGKARQKRGSYAEELDQAA